MAKQADRRSTGNDESLAKLLKLAGERPQIPLAVESRVYHRVQQEWQKSTAKPNADKVYEKVHKTWRRNARRGRLLRWLLPLGTAATLVVAVMLSSQPKPLVVPVVGTVSKLVSEGALARRYAAGSAVRAGERIATGPGEGLSLQLAGNESLRIDENTVIRIDANDSFALLGGRVYADTGQYVYRQGGLEISTSLGVVSDVGTQFAVSLENSSLDVAVREGRVDVHRESDSFSARMGERLTISAGETARVVELDTHDAYWNWIAGLTPDFDIANKSLLDFLKWASRETGRELRFASDESRMFAMRTDLHGSLDGLTPEEALHAILATTTVRYEITADKVLISDQR